MKKIPCQGCLNRREALSGSAKLGIAMTVGASALAVACGDRNKSSGDSGQAVTANSSGLISLDFKTYPNLQNVGGSYRLNVNGSPISVTRISNTQVVAVLASCTHQGVTLNDYSGGSFSCPAHGAAFSADGTVTAGPARSNLSTYPATISATGVQVTVG